MPETVTDVGEAMNKNELKKQCEEFLNKHSTLLFHGIQVPHLEAFARALVFRGMEKVKEYYSQHIHDDLADYPDKFVTWINTEIHRIKEGA
jgi:hypothetical protein